MLVGEIDVADLVIGLPGHQDLLWPLHEEERMNAVQNETRNADRPTCRLRGKAALAGTNDLVVLAQILFRPGVQTWALRIAGGDGRLPPCPSKLLVGDTGNAGVPSDGTWTGARWKEVGDHRNPADTGIGREVGRKRGRVKRCCCASAY